MATTTLTTDLVTVALGETPADSGTWDGGKSNLYDTETFVEGTGSQQYIANSSGTAILYFQPTSSVSVGTSSVLRIWAMVTDSFRSDSKANGGIKVYATNGSAATWYYHGADTLNTLWTQFVVDTGTTPSVGSNPFGSNITQFGIQIEFMYLGKNTPTCWVDAIRYGNVITATGGTSGDEIDIESIFVEDDSSKYGILMKSAETGIYSVRGNVVVGDSSGTLSTYFKTEGKVIIAEDFDWGATDMLALNFVGNATGTTDIQLLGCFVSATGDQLNIDVTDTDITDLTFSGNTFGNIAGLAFQSGFVVTSNVFSNCFVIDPGASTFQYNTLANCTDTDGALNWSSSSVDATDCSFNNNTLAIHIPATVTGPITFDALLFSGNTTDVYWAGTSGTLTINMSNGSNATTTSTAGGTIVLNSSVTVTIESNVSLVGAEIRIYDQDNSPVGSLGTELSGVESCSTSTYVFSEDASNIVFIQVQLSGYEEFGQVYTMPTSNSVFTATLKKETNL